MNEGAMTVRTFVQNLHTDKRMTPVEAAYVAGFLDGEGTLSIGKTVRKENRAGFRYTPLMVIANSHFEGLQRVREMCGNGRISGNYHKGAPHHKTVYVLRFSSNQVRHILPQIKPYLFLKARQADLVQAFVDTIRNGKNATVADNERFEQLRSEVRSLNVRGQSPDTAPAAIFLRPARSRWDIAAQVN